MNIRAYMPSCAARDQTRAVTIANLMSTDWLEPPVVCLEEPKWDLPLQRHIVLLRRTLEVALQDDNDLILLVEDDIVFNRHLRHNIEAWRPVRELRENEQLFASLFNPGIRFVKTNPKLAYGEAHLDSVMGAQALLIARETAHHIATCWGICPGIHADIKLARLAAIVCPILYHIPSLVQHVGFTSTWGGPFRSAPDFDVEWKAN